jgi:hypothetical protein
MPEALGTSTMKFDGQDAGSGRDEGRGERTLTRAEVQHEVAGANRRVLDYAISPVSLECVPAPGSA